MADSGPSAPERGERQSRRLNPVLSGPQERTACRVRQLACRVYCLNNARVVANVYVVPPAFGASAVWPLGLPSTGVRDRDVRLAVERCNCPELPPRVSSGYVERATDGSAQRIAGCWDGPPVGPLKRSFAGDAFTLNRSAGLVGTLAQSQRRIFPACNATACTATLHDTPTRCRPIAPQPSLLFGLPDWT